MKRCILTLSILLCAAALSAQVGRLGMEPTPKNFDAALPAATARAGKNQLPAQADLSASFPKPGYQGTQNSCVAWATAYAVKSYQENQKRGWGVADNDKTFSPSFIYNQINKGQDAGSTIPDALELVKTQGAATLKTMPYGDYRQQPSSQARQEASRFKADSYERLDGKNTLALKTLLAGGNPIIVGMKTYENFLTYKSGVYRSVSGANLGGHAMVIVGYDDSKNAFKILNSWGDGWGEKGFVWYDYKLFADMHHTAMVMYGKPDNTPTVSYPPNNLTASAGAYSDKIQLTWDAVTNADYYIVFRADGTPVTFNKIADVKGTTFIDTAVKSKTDYFYAVKSVGPGGESGFSSTALGSLKAAAELGAPRNIQGQYTNKRIRLLWASVQGAEGYRVYRWDNVPQQWVRIGVSANEGFEDANLPAGSTGERYVVTAYARDQESKSGPGLYVAVPPPQEPPKPPAPPAQVKASQGTYRDKIEVSWTAVPGATSYIVRKWSDRSKVWTDLGRTGATTYVDTNVSERKGLYTIVTLRGTETGEASPIAEGWLSTAPKKQEPIRFADDKYREEFFTRAEKFFKDDNFFKDDKIFTGKGEFFNNFEEANFFFFDEQAFFKVDEKKFFGPGEKDFFGDSKGFF